LLVHRFLSSGPLAAILPLLPRSVQLGDQLGLFACVTRATLTLDALKGCLAENDSQNEIAPRLDQICPG